MKYLRFTIVDHVCLGGEYPRQYNIPDMAPGGVFWVDAPAGFSWRIENGKAMVEPGWWRRLKRRITGRW